MARVEPIDERDQQERRARQRGERGIRPRRTAVDRAAGNAESVVVAAELTARATVDPNERK